MIKLKSSRNYIIIKNRKELEIAKECDVCGFIIQEESNVIFIWEKLFGKWNRNRFVVFDTAKEKEEEVTGLKAYQSFYSYCGKTEVDRMKKILTPIPVWEGYEQMHFANIEFLSMKLYQPIFEFDVNSSFTYGVTQLPDGFQPLKEYMLELYTLKENAQNDITRKKYKNLMNFLIGYFARVKDLTAVRSEIIRESNLNVELHMSKIVKNKGVCYISNTDSIITNIKGAEVMLPIVGTGLGEFKLATTTDRLFYKSPNAYQLGEKVVYSGVSYYARKHTDFFKDIVAIQKGTLIKGFEFVIDEYDKDYSKICKVKFGEIRVEVVNIIGELLEVVNYKLGD